MEQSNIENEYKALREEILRLEKEVLTITFYVFSITLLIAGLNVKNSENSFLSPTLYQIVLTWGLGRYINATRLRLRLSTYIQVFIEPLTDSLKWENRNNEFKKYKGITLNKWFNKFISLFFLLTILGLFLTFGQLSHISRCIDKDQLLIWLTMILQLTNIYLLIEAVFSYPSPGKYIDIWKKIDTVEMGVAKSPHQNNP